MRDRFASVIFIIAFIFFGLYQIFNKNEPKVLKLITPTIIQIDMNGNNIVDDNETFCIPDIETFTANLKYNSEELANSLGLTYGQSIAVGYLTDEYAKNILYGTNIKIEETDNIKPNCRSANILIEGEDYATLLKNNGYSIKNNKPENEKIFSALLDKASKLKLVILNHHSLKYHTLDCKYGHVAEDSVVLESKELTNDFKPCQFCHVEQNIQNNKNNVSDNKVSIPPPPNIVTDGNLKLVLTDFTTILKPDRNCFNQACKEFLSLINNAANSIDLAIYGWADLPAIDKALDDASKRGVAVRIVYETNTTNDNYYKETINLIGKYKQNVSDEIQNMPKLTNMLMHNKFAVFDKSKVYTGSMNFSTTGFSGFNHNSILIINSKNIANLYEKEFEQMYNGKFHTLKEKSSDNENISEGSVTLSVYFSPQDKALSEKIVPIIKNSKHYIYVPTFILTHKLIKQELINANNRGVDVKVIIDATNTHGKHSVYSEIKASGIPIKVENYAGKMHSKSMIIDDEYLIVGSANFSNSGENKNDENLVIIKSPKMAKVYKDYFNYFWTKIPDKYLKYTLRAESFDSIGSCYDGVDNNFDGKIDNQDEGCKKHK